MGLRVRRIVTGHDAVGRALVKIDDAPAPRSSRPGHEAIVVWTAQDNPVDNTGEEDAALRAVGSTLPDGSVFRVISYAPGVASRNHRTSSIDYAVVISGEIDMQLDDSVVHLRAGDVLVQRGTVHNWVNSGSEPCVIAFVLIDAKPVLAPEG